MLKNKVAHFPNSEKKPKKYSGRETAKRAIDAIGTKGYNPEKKNCQHFSSWCKTGVAKSKQGDALRDLRKLTFADIFIYAPLGYIIDKMEKSKKKKRKSRPKVRAK